jgi:hypothetical protein
MRNIGVLSFHTTAVRSALREIADADAGLAICRRTVELGLITPPACLSIAAYVSAIANDQIMQRQLEKVLDTLEPFIKANMIGEEAQRLVRRPLAKLATLLRTENEAPLMGRLLTLAPADDPAFAPAVARYLVSILKALSRLGHPAGTGPLLVGASHHAWPTESLGEIAPPVLAIIRSAIAEKSWAAAADYLEQLEKLAPGRITGDTKLVSMLADAETGDALKGALLQGKAFAAFAALSSALGEGKKPSAPAAADSRAREAAWRASAAKSAEQIAQLQLKVAGLTAERAPGDIPDGEDNTPIETAARVADYVRAAREQRNARLHTDLLTLSATDIVDKGEVETGHTKEVYEDHWGKRLAGINKRVESGEHIATILRSMRPAPHGILQRNRVSGAISDYYLSRYPVFGPNKRPVARIEVSGSRYSVANNVDPLTILQGRCQKYPYIVELGSGPGWNLFDLFIYLGKEGRNRRFFALEYTDSGLDVTKSLAKACDGIQMTTALFDYTKPDLSCIPDDQPTLFFSHHSIEQVKEISPDLYQQILARKHPFELLHFEPIGWQRFPELVEARMSDDPLLHRILTEGRLATIPTDIGVAINAAVNSWRVGYNRNCIPILNQLERERRIKIADRIYDFTSRMSVNPTNPTTYLRVMRHGRAPEA